ncbi:hypothetical protein [Streptomyces sp. NPDC052721]
MAELLTTGLIALLSATRTAQAADTDRAVGPWNMFGGSQSGGSSPESR